MSPTPPSNLEGRSQETWERTQTDFQGQGVQPRQVRVAAAPLETVPGTSNIGCPSNALKQFIRNNSMEGARAPALLVSALLRWVQRFGACAAQCLVPRHLGLVRVGARSVHAPRRFGTRRSVHRRSVHAPRRSTLRRSTLGASTLGARTSTLDARCTHLDASTLGACTSTLDASALDARCTHLDTRRFGASTLGARTSTLNASALDARRVDASTLGTLLDARCSHLNASALDARLTHLDA
ncbi:UNVERIFIED_CONTAM: hypothetical protein FKN15_032210 [Acipenser sinensis]